ncbi:hypothetical protein DYBT9275_02380 [Dyadobacter sp. CECT 9275]|uniref:N-acetyltransferase domain-containing protein n=1 Tax=Dyadobacter helix TaxID=2822344 RepID=A0A916JC12_9BACT|nr:GNAT family N-acetyltransferase [Dyadobacter sp. CECT 9275]CAG5000080.1 hypothetical protein DYBT9275_02380 [Dyadobacter sp. CECT 9275]
MQEASAFQIRPMSATDLPLCRHLVQEAGWNQLDADWLRAMELEPEGCFVAMADNFPLATTTTCRLGGIGWIAMVLVDKKARGQGIARRMVEYAIAYLERNGVETIRLDATAMGQGLYKKLGFREEYEVIRFCGYPAPADLYRGDLQVVSTDSQIMAEIMDLDKKATGTDRKSFVNALLRIADSPFYYDSLPGENTVTAFAGFREGCNAVQIGPAVALTPDSGGKVLDAVVSHFVGKQVYIDIPVPNQPAVMWAATQGFTEQRRFMRMYRGIEVQDAPGLIWASSGPEKG